MTLDRALEALQRANDALGGLTKFAKLCGYRDRRNMHYWMTSGKPFPAELALIAERETRRVATLRNDARLIVTCEELRPDLDWAVIRANPPTRRSRRDLLRA
jgi:DNA-binding transcriptional regulator YdaS (Cro superfamily)